MKFLDLADASSALVATRSRTAKIQLLADFLRALAPDERAVGTAWLSGVLLDGRLGLGPAAVQALRGIAPAQAPTLTLSGVRQRLNSLQTLTGKGSTRERQGVLTELFELATIQEQAFLRRLLIGELRQGALEGLMTEAIAMAAAVPVTEVRRAIMLAGEVAPVADAALSAGRQGLARFRLDLFKPVSPMLASPTEDVDSALSALGTAIFEYKLDGARVQIHKQGDDIKIYSRTGREVTFSLPEIVLEVAALPAAALILDGEVLALGPDGTPRAFQDSMRRFGRRLDVDNMQSQIPMSLFCFDCLHVDGDDLIDRPAAERHRILQALLPPHLVVPRLVTDEQTAADDFLRAALAAGHEGLMAKSLESPYEAGSRGASWLKIKVAHSVDLVVLAAEWGSGRRKGWLSNLHLGARAENGFVMLGKTFKGLTDELLAWQTEKLLALATSDPRAYVVEVRPELVVEIAFNELQTSSRYPGGVALRFARVIRYREDKTAADADTLDMVRAVAAKQ
ncbi:MAG TPA: ATP-dependent DNA ligase [Hyphomicrobiales bacterium]|nr:ATP-dependent DNA ligase [Hyphomicrobiales bacterium]